MKITAVIQARVGSSRLPAKVLMDIQGKPMLWHIVKRVSSAKLIDEVVIATSKNNNNDRIVKFAKEHHFKIFRGSENNCLDRYYKAAKEFKADVVVRITADCALICPEVIDNVVSEYLRNSYDYVTNTIYYTYPEGCDVEVFSFEALKKAWRECRDSVAREHVTPYFKDSGRFRIKNLENKIHINPEEYKWSVDRIEDMEFVRRVYKCLYHGNVFSYKEIMDLLEKYPELKQINSKAIINEGFYRDFLKLPKIKAKKLTINKSLLLKRKTEKLIPNCSQTLSKSYSQFVYGVAPIFLEKGKGSHVWDIDGNEYIDYAMALGPVILGHNYPAITSAIKKIAGKGVTFTLPHRLETELAELLCRTIPCAEMVRFGKNGSDATSGAVRVARALTDRDKVACCGYHGWQDWYIGVTTRNKGVPGEVRKLTSTFEYNKIETLEKIFAKNPKQIACVIMEPVGVVEPEDNFLQKVKELTHKNGAILIFDEVVTGFRISLGGAQEYFNVRPDLACFGKAMSNGLPISAVVGKREIMKHFEEVFYSFTFGGEIVSIAAAIGTIEELKKKNVIRHLWEQGRKIKDGYNVLSKEYGLEKFTKCIGLPPRTVIVFKNRRGEDDLLLKSLFQQECLKRKVLFTDDHNICFSHTDKDIDYTLRVYRTALDILGDAISKNKVRKLLEGEPVRPVFRKP